MKNQPLVSVIVPIYNVEKYLKKCLDTIISQTYKNLEIILVDDGSTDNSGDIANSYAKNDKRIKVVHKENGGLSSARNAGMKYATGEWVSFIDSDDYVDKKFIATLVDVATSNDADIATCNLEPFSDDGSILKKTPNWPSEIMSGKQAVDDMLKNKRPAYICLNLFRTEAFRKNKIAFPDGKDYEDIATKIKLLYFAKKVAFSNDKLYFYLIRKGSITGKSFSRSRYIDFLSAIEDARNFLTNSGQSEEFVFLDYFEFYSLITLMNYLAREKKKSKEMKTYWRSIRKRLKKLYPVTKFPTSKVKFIYKVTLMLSTNITVYSAIYKGLKK